MSIPKTTSVGVVGAAVVASGVVGASAVVSGVVGASVSFLESFLKSSELPLSLRESSVLLRLAIR